MQSLFYEQYKCRTFQPSFNQSSFRTEIKFSNADAIYNAGTMRVANLGVTAPNAGNYNLLTGALGVVRMITLYDGNVVLDQCRHCNYYTAFSNYNGSNDASKSYDNYLKQKAGGMEDVRLIQQNGAAQGQQEGVVVLNSSSVANTTVATTQQGLAYLHEFLPLLKQMPYLACNLFKNLRIVIEYETQANRICEAGVSGTTQPFLILDEWMIEPNEKASVLASIMKQPVMWWAVEHDSFNVPGLQATGDVTANIVSLPAPITNGNPRGFNGKTLGTLLMVKTGGSPVVADSNCRAMGSRAQYAETYQINVNSVPIFPQALTNTAEVLGLLHDATGTCATVACFESQDVGLGAAANTPEAELSREQHYMKAVIGQKISDLRIEYGRSFVFSSNGGNQTARPYNMPIRLQLFGEIRKALSFQKNGTYGIAYV